MATLTFQENLNIKDKKHKFALVVNEYILQYKCLFQGCKIVNTLVESVAHVGLDLCSVV